jgi:hypothetical protein
MQFKNQIPGMRLHALLRAVFKVCLQLDETGGQTCENVVLESKKNFGFKKECTLLQLESEYFY